MGRDNDSELLCVLICITSSYRVVKMTNLKKKKNLKNSLLECMIEHTSLTTLYIKQPKIRRNIWITEIGLLI